MISWANPERLSWLWGILHLGRLAGPSFLAPATRQTELADKQSWSRWFAETLSGLGDREGRPGPQCRPRWWCWRWHAPVGERLVPAPAKGADVVLVVDASSMLAQDVAPDRLGLARRDLRRLVDSLGTQSDRPGGIRRAAPSARFRSPRIGRPCHLLDALGRTFFPRPGPKSAGHRHGSRDDGALPSLARKVVVLVTDGGDHGKGSTDEAQHLAQLGVELHVVGVGGSCGRPHPLPDGGSRQDREGNIVTVRLESETLEVLAEAGRGRYAELSPKSWNLASCWSLSTQWSPKAANLECGWNASTGSTGFWSRR
ncbi:MAG: hypothetical protein IPN71_07285 [Fibrobacteres bacterium]|nr:hypothetical protein [Fibrobacterota bacterium]